MIVISTNNGVKTDNCLSNLLNSLQGCQRTVCVVDTQSRDRVSLDYIEHLKTTREYNFPLHVLTTPNKNYDTGAYLHAVNTLPAERYYFLHDSMIVKNLTIKDVQLFDHIDKHLTEDVVVVPFLAGYGVEVERVFIKPLQERFNTAEYSNVIVGPMFSILDTTIKKIDFSKILLPRNKFEATLFERAWPVLFKQYNISMKLLPSGGDYFKKHNGHRG